MNRLPGLLASLLLATVAVADEPTPAPATYRLDFFHTGGKGGPEIFAVDRLRLEPLPWPGHPSRAVDDGRSGVYRYEVRDAAGQLLQQLTALHGLAAGGVIPKAQRLAARFQVAGEQRL